MRGRKPHPTAVKLLRNNPGRRPLNLHEPTHATIDPAMPAELEEREGRTWTSAARAEWLRIVATLGRGHCTTVDRSTLIAYCVKFGQWQDLEAEASRHPYIVKSPSGYPIPNPALGMANTALKLMLKSAVELGITPSARSRIVAAPFEADPAIAPDEFTKFQRRRTNLK